jgi:hypothetical protein
MGTSAMNKTSAVSKRTTAGAETYRGLPYEFVIRLQATTKIKLYVRMTVHLC